MEGTAEFHHQIADTLLPQAEPVFDDATALDTTVDMLNASSARVQGLIGPSLFQGELLTAAAVTAYGCRRMRIPRGVTTTKHPTISSKRTDRTVASANSRYRRRLSTAARRRITPTYVPGT